MYGHLHSWLLIINSKNISVFLHPSEVYSVSVYFGGARDGRIAHFWFVSHDPGAPIFGTATPLSPILMAIFPGGNMLCVLLYIGW